MNRASFAAILTYVSRRHEFSARHVGPWLAARQRCAGEGSSAGTAGPTSPVEVHCRRPPRKSRKKPSVGRFQAPVKACAGSHLSARFPRSMSRTHRHACRLPPPGTPGSARRNPPRRSPNRSARGPHGMLTYGGALHPNEAAGTRRACTHLRATAGEDSLNNPGSGQTLIVRIQRL